MIFYDLTVANYSYIILIKITKIQVLAHQFTLYAEIYLVSALLKELEQQLAN